MDTFMDVVKQMLKSKKFLALVAGLIVWLVGQAGLDVSEGDVLPLLGTIASYIIGQGIADNGKERVKEAGKLAQAGKGGGQGAPLGSGQ